MATTSQPASSAAAASLGPERSSRSRRETDVETVRTAARMSRRLTWIEIGDRYPDMSAVDR
jgi:hypothetical protein